MASTLERQSVAFTDEAEVILRKTLERTERRIRSKAIEEAARLRGWPPEITGSDVLKADRELRQPEAFRSETSRWHMTDEPRLARVRKLKAYRRLTLAEKLAKLYAAIGGIFTVAGLFYAPLYETVSRLFQDQYWKKGLLISAAGISICTLGLLLQFVIRKRIVSSPAESQADRDGAKPLHYY